VLPGGEDAIDVAQAKAGITHGVGDGLEMQGELALAGEDADLVALVDSHDTGRVRQFFHDAGSHRGMVTSSLSLEKTTRTGISHRRAPGSGATLTRFVSMRGPSANSTMARMYGGGTFIARLMDWWAMANEYSVPRPLARTQPMSRAPQRGQRIRG
jgi:hypothetical protein